MTTVLVDLENLVVASDSRRSRGDADSIDFVYLDNTRKIYTSNNGNTIIAGAGLLSDLLEAVAYGEVPKKSTSLLLKVQRFPLKIELYRGRELLEKHTRLTLWNAWISFGSGARKLNEDTSIDWNAMSAEDLIKKACELDKYSGGEVQQMSISDGYLYEDIH